MSHFGFLCPPYAGHLNPMQALASALVERGHAATFLGLAEIGETLSDRRIGFAALGSASHPRGTLLRMVEHMTHPRGLGLFSILRDAARLTDMVCRDAPAAIAAHGIDALVVDQLEPGGGLVAAARDMPFVSVANALLIDREDAVPPPFLGWPYDPSERGLARNRGGYRVADVLMSGLGRVIARHAAAFGLPARRTIESCLSPLAQVSQTVAGFDFPRRALPSTMHQCGPLRGPEAEAGLAGLLDDRRPLVFASLGTLQGGRIAVFRRIAEACHALDLHLVIAHGGRLTPAEIASLPGGAVVRAFVPQRALLRHAALAITNGGLNTVLDALAAAIPVIAIPVAFEQAAIGARLAYRGAGLAVPLRRLSTSVLQGAIATVLNNPGFAAQARRIAVDIATAGGVARAATIIEAVASEGRAGDEAAA